MDSSRKHSPAAAGPRPWPFLPLTTDRRREWGLVALLMLIMLLKGMMWSLALPLWQGPDEDDHYAVIQFIGEHGRLPGLDDEILPDEVSISRELADVGRLDYRPEQRQGWSDTAVGLREAEFAQLPSQMRTSTDLGITAKLIHGTPLYYALAAIPYRLVGYDADLLLRVQVQRLFSLLLSAPIVLVAYLTSQLLFPTNAAIRLTVPTLVAFHPQLTQMTAVVSVDGFFFVLYSLLIYFCLRVYYHQFSWRLAWAIALTFVMGMLIKPTMNGVVPLVAMAIFYDLWRRWPERGLIIKQIAVMVLLIAIPVAWWMQRSLWLNDDLFYFNPISKGHRLVLNPFYDYQFLPHLIDYYQSVWGGIFISWWAHFGWVDTAVAPWMYNLLRGLTVLAILGLCWHGWRRWPHRPSYQAWRQGQRMAPVSVWLFLALTILMPIVLIQFYDLTFWWEYGMGRGLQGRYWLTTAVPMLTFFTLGLLYCLPARWHTAVHVGLRVGMILFHIVAFLAYLLPRYYL